MEATCLCEKVTMRVNMPEGQQLPAHLCHCNVCKKMSGSAFGTFSMIKADTVSFDNTDNLTCFSQVTERGNHANTYFCSTCGIVFKHELAELKDATGLLVVPTGLFEKIPAPAEEYYAIRRCPWVMPTDATQHETVPSPQTFLSKA